MKSLKRILLPMTSALALCAAMPAAMATTVNFTYTGGGASACPGCTTVGTGSFSFAGSPSSLALVDLTAFSLVNDFGSGNTFFTYGPGDLISFSAALDAAANVTVLSLATAYVDGVGPNNIPESLVVTSLTDAATFSKAPGSPFSAHLTSGSVSATTVASAVPEPTSAALVLVGIGVVVIATRQGRTDKGPERKRLA